MIKYTICEICSVEPISAVAKVDFCAFLALGDRRSCAFMVVSDDSAVFRSIKSYRETVLCIEGARRA